MCIVAPEEVPRYKTANMAVMNFFIKNLKQKYSYFKVNGLYNFMELLYFNDIHLLATVLFAHKNGFK
jgi:hypothetical protein